MGRYGAQHTFVYVPKGRGAEALASARGLSARWSESTVGKTALSLHRKEPSVLGGGHTVTANYATSRASCRSPVTNTQYLATAESSASGRVFARISSAIKCISAFAAG